MDAWQRNRTEDEWSDGSDNGALVAPGNYTVGFATRTGGVTTELGLIRDFKVLPLGEGALKGAAPEEVGRFQRQLAEVTRDHSGAVARVAELIERMGAMQSVMKRTPGALGQLAVETNGLTQRLKGLGRTLSGDPLLEAMNEPGAPSVASRLSHVSIGTKYSTYGPTPAHRESLAIAQREVRAVLEAIEEIREIELPRYDSMLKSLGAPWSPGR